jgi:hypothetical protein
MCAQNIIVMVVMTIYMPLLLTLIRPTEVRTFARTRHAQTRARGLTARRRCAQIKPTQETVFTTVAQVLSRSRALVPERSSNICVRAWLGRR